jgi:hypothetical protein
MTHTLLWEVTEHCADKISAILCEPYSTPFRVWYDNLSPNANLNKRVQGHLQFIYNISGGKRGTPRDGKAVLLAIIHASVLVENEVILGANAYMSDREVEYDDRESLNNEELNKNAVYCFVCKLDRYYTACHNIVRGLVSLHRSGCPFTIKVETTPQAHPRRRVSTET